jgi:hypothetical protein
MPDPATATDQLFHEGEEILVADGNAPWSGFQGGAS